MRQFLAVLLGIIILIVAVGGLLLLVRATGHSSVLTSNCTAPCWHGVSPGHTTAWQVVDSLFAVPDVRSIEQWGDTYEDTTIRWVFQFPTLDSSGFIYCREGVVVIVSINTMGSLDLGQLLAYLGEPRSIWLALAQTQDGGRLAVNLIFPEAGVIATVETELSRADGQVTVELSPRLPVRRVLYLDGTRYPRLIGPMELFGETEESILEKMRPWPGLGAALHVPDP